VAVLPKNVLFVTISVEGLPKLIAPPSPFAIQLLKIKLLRVTFALAMLKILEVVVVVVLPLIVTLWLPVPPLIVIPLPITIWSPVN
jgi:hypothetical protein